MSQHSDPVALNLLSWKSVTEGLISFKGLQAIPSNKKSVDGGASFVKEFLPPPLELEKVFSVLTQTTTERRLKPICIYILNILNLCFVCGSNLLCLSLISWFKLQQLVSTCLIHNCHHSSSDPNLGNVLKKLWTQSSYFYQSSEAF